MADFRKIFENEVDVPVIKKSGCTNKNVDIAIIHDTQVIVTGWTSSNFQFSQLQLKQDLHILDNGTIGQIEIDGQLLEDWIVDIFKKDVRLLTDRQLQTLQHLGTNGIKR